MSIMSEIDRITSCISSAYSVIIDEKQSAFSGDRTSYNLVQAINAIPETRTVTRNIQGYFAVLPTGYNKIKCIRSEAFSGNYGKSGLKTSVSLTEDSVIEVKMSVEKKSYTCFSLRARTLSGDNSNSMINVSTSYSSSSPNYVTVKCGIRNGNSISRQISVASNDTVVTYKIDFSTNGFYIDSSYVGTLEFPSVSVLEYLLVLTSEPTTAGGGGTYYYYPGDIYMISLKQKSTNIFDRFLVPCTGSSLVGMKDIIPMDDMQFRSLLTSTSTVAFTAIQE